MQENTRDLACLIRYNSSELDTYRADITAEADNYILLIVSTNSTTNTGAMALNEITRNCSYMLQSFIQWPTLPHLKQADLVRGEVHS
jgi:hypothetical protein